MDLVLTEGYDFEEMGLEINAVLAKENAHFLERLDEAATTEENFFGEAVLHENVFKSAWEYIKKLLNKAKEWILKIFRKFWDWLSSFFRSNQNFARKYKNAFNAAIKDLDSDFEVKVNVDITKFDKLKGENTINEIGKLLEDCVSGDVFNASNADKESEVKTKLEEYEKIADEFNSATTLSGSDIQGINEFMKLISGANSAKEKVQKVEKAATKTLKDVESKVSKLVSKDKNASDDTKEGLQKVKSTVSEGVSAINTISSTQCSAVKKACSSARKVVLKVISASHTAKYKKNIEKESSMFNFGDAFEEAADFVW